MRNNIFHIFTFSILINLFSACNKGSDDFLLIKTESDLDQYAIEIFNDKLYLVGGDAWKQCDLSISDDGKKWETEYFTNRALFDLHATDYEILAVGTSGYLYTGEESLERKELTTTNQLRAITGISNEFITIAGKDFNKGWIYPLDNNYNVLKEHFYNHELSDVKCNNAGNCIAVGFGIILTSEDRGINWKRSNQTGDFYNSLAFNSKDSPYVVGYAGSILYSQDEGTSWESIKGGHSPLVNNKPFRKIKFYDQNGYIVGDNGTIWKTVDDGETWNDISINTDLDLLDFVFFHEELIIAAEAGNVLVING